MADRFTERPASLGRSFTSFMMALQRPGRASSSVELDITDLSARMKEVRRLTRRGVSLTAYTAFTICRTVEQFPVLNSFRHRGRLITFDDLDLVCSVERMTEQERIVRGCMLRACQSLALQDIGAQLRQAAKAPLTEDYFSQPIDRLLALPPWIWATALRMKINDPFWIKRHLGTMSLTTLRYPGLDRPFIAFPPSWWTLGVALCPVFERWQATPQGVQKRTCVTVAFVMDHAVLDGIDALRACRTFSDRLTSGDGLEAFAAAQPLASPDARSTSTCEDRHADVAH